MLRSPDGCQRPATTVTVEVQRRGLVGEHSELPHRRGSRLVRKASAGECVVVGEFPGHAGDAGNRRRFQRFVPRDRGSRRELVRGRWPAHHRPAEQSIFQPNPARFGRVDGGLCRRPPRRIRRQDQRGDQRHHPLGAGPDHAQGKPSPLPTEALAPPMAVSISVTAARSGGISSP